MRLALLALSIMALTACSATPDPVMPAPATAVFEPYIFTGPGGVKVEAEKGTFSVPENRADPNSRTISISFVRFPSTSATPGDPIVYLAGGPGGGGVATAMGARFPLFMALREIADVIAFDQRGTGLSSPTPSCVNVPPYGADTPLHGPASLPSIAPA